MSWLEAATGLTLVSGAFSGLMLACAWWFDW
jgi:hypothetical protein